MIRTTRPRAGAAVAGMLALVLATGSAAVAATTPVVAPNGLGGTVTLDNDHYGPGETITLTGSGFSLAPGTESAPGQAVIAVKLADGYTETGFPWVAGGPDHIDPEDTYGAGSGGYAAFTIRPGGTFTGTLTIPADWTGFGATWLRFLGGSVTTEPDGLGKKLLAQSFTAPFVVLNSATGYAEVTTLAHTPGSVNNASIGVTLRGFERQDGEGGQKVAFKIDGAGPVLGCIETDGDGDAAGTVALPDDLELVAGPHVLNVLAGSACGEGPQAPGRSLSLAFTVTTAAVTSTQHVPGGEVTVRLDRFLKKGVYGGQKVAFKVDGGATLACATTDVQGNGTATVPLPADLTLGAHTLNVLAGTACGEGADLPARSIPLSFTVTAAPPAPAPAPLAATGKASVTGKARVGQTVAAVAPRYSYSTGVKLGYQWLRGGKAISGATARTYAVKPADRKARLSVRITASHATGGTVVSTSAATAKVAAGTFRVAKKPVVKGTKKVGKKLSVRKATWSVKGVKVSYQWLRNGKKIKGATKATYKVKKADRAKKLSVRVTAEKSGYTTVKVASKAVKIAKK